MHRVRFVFLFTLVFASLGLELLSAQSAAPFDFNLLVTENNISNIVQNGSTVPMSTTIGTQIQATVVATNNASFPVTIQTAPQIVAGSNEITVTGPQGVTYPLTVGPSGTYTFVVTYAPTNASQATTEIGVPYTEPGSGGSPVNNAIVLFFQGTAPTFTLAYSLAPNNNLLSIQSGGTITFPPTQLNTPATASLVIANTGSGPGEITGIALTSGSPAFQLSNVPLATPTVPYTLAGGSQLSPPIGITYTPTKVETDTGTIVITFQGGATDTINLSGSGVTSTFAYAYIPAGSTTPVPVSPPGPIVFPSVPIATTGTQGSSTVIVQVTNSGSATGTISAISVSGPGFQLAGAPPTFPITLTQGGVTSFSLSYTPTQVGSQTGALVIGSSVFTLSGQGLGPQIAVSYLVSGASVTVPNGGAVDLPPTQVGQSSSVTVTVTNSGTAAATIPLVTTAAPFSVPILAPIVLQPGQSSTFQLTFTPTVVGPVAGTLLIGNTTVALAGSGTSPQSIGSYTITGPSGTVSPATQAPVTLTLANPYPVDITGVLTLTTEGSIGTDTSVQFSNGSRLADFTIPANTTVAQFTGYGPQIYVQTGTVAETVTLSATFATATGNVNVTPTSPSTLQFTLSQLAPVLESVSANNVSDTGFTLVIVGYTTTRSLGTLRVTFNPASGYNLGSGATYSTDLSAAASVWFQSPTAQQYGGQFEVTLPFNLSGKITATQAPIDAIASVSVTLSNSVGTSTSVQAAVP